MRKDIIIISGKGGVGKTVVACLLAQELARKHGKTALCDLDIDSSNVASVMNIKTETPPVTEIEGIRKVKPIKFDGDLEINSISAMLSDTSISHTGSQYRRMVRDLLENTAWSDDIEYLVADMPPSVSDIFRETVEYMKSKGTFLGAVVVEQPNSVEDGRRAYEICKRLFIPIIGFVENMSGAEMDGQPVKCSCGCGKEFVPFGSGGIKEFAKEVGGDFIGRIPLSLEIAQSRPPKATEGVAARTISSLAKKIALAPIPKIPKDRIREASGTVIFVKNVMEAFFEVLWRVNKKLNIGELREKYGRKKDRGFLKVTITDCPEVLSKYYGTFYIGIEEGKWKVYRDPIPPNIKVVASIKLKSGVLACILKEKIPVMDPFTHKVYNEPYSFTKAVNNGDIEMYGDRVFIDFLFMDYLFAHLSELSDLKEAKEEIERSRAKV
ncbi:MAG: P-loop NTPase [Candidatus Methanospirareceae archaeon]